MIVTVTPNPSIDYLLNTDKLIQGNLNRIENERFVIGGKGINVSLMLNSLKINSIATGFISGFTGKYIEEEIQKYKYIDTNFININNNPTRINIKLKVNDIETEINASGTSVSESEFNDLKKYISTLNNQDILILSGSIAKGLNNDMYMDLAKMCYNNKIKFIVDSTKNSLLKTLQYNPFLIKPNLEELMEIFDVELVLESDIIKYAKKLQEKGAKNVLVSMGNKGSILITDTKIYKALPIKLKEISTVGAGDSMIAGFIVEYEKSKDYVKALKLATACSISTVLSSSIGDIELINKYLKLIEIKEIIN